MKRALKYLLLAVPLTAAGLFFHLVGGATIVQEYFWHDAPEELGFSFDFCSRGTNEHPGVREIVWNKDTAIINTVLAPNCGTTWLFGNYKVEGGNKLILGYKSIVPSLTACNCNYRAIYRVEGLERKEYEVEIREYAFINKTPWLMRVMMEMDPGIVEIEEF
ncbi:hypothetical protein ACFPTX_02925 [Pseudomonas sp. GCM10022188]|uniref:hypothetical protein n=1 Tax=Pseudomonas TaxID=286 RepID=UPI001E37E4F0|nr:hypothetical protein [Pseudomonas oryzagri]MCC6076665.1 hypothetical protein [Pseudomonas oryzagri]